MEGQPYYLPFRCFFSKAGKVYMHYLCGRKLSCGTNSGLENCSNGKLTQFRGGDTHRFPFSSTGAV